MAQVWGKLDFVYLFEGRLACACRHLLDKSNALCMANTPAGLVLRNDSRSFVMQTEALQNGGKRFDGKLAVFAWRREDEKAVGAQERNNKNNR